MKRLLSVLLSALIAASGAAAQTFVDLEFVKQAIARGASSWDARDEATFAKGNIPGAVNIPYEANWIDPEARNKMRKGLVKDTAGSALTPRDELR